MSIALQVETATTWAVVDDEGGVVVILSGADASRVAAEYRSDGYRTMLLTPEF